MTDFEHPVGATQLNGAANPWQHHDNKLLQGHRVSEPIKHDLGVVDPRNSFDSAPEYLFGQLPQVYEDYALDNIAEYGGDPAAYACAFLAVFCGVLHSSVEMETRPGKGNWKCPNEHSLTLGKSGSNKSGMFKDLTRFQFLWQEALLKGVTGKRKAGTSPPMIILQNGSVEGVLLQCQDNRGERLIVANDEAMSFYMGTGAHHHESGTSMMTDLVCKLYDGESYYKRLVRADIKIPRALGTTIMATVIEKMSGWEGFATMISSGAMARTTVGLISRPMKRDASLRRPGVEKAMADLLFKVRTLRDIRFTLAEDSHEVWSDYISTREEINAEMSEESSGLAEWCRKYDMRIMSLASIFQAIEFCEGNMLNFEPFDIPRTAEDEDKVGGGMTRQGKLVQISYENLIRAIDFEKGFLFETQKYFYTVAEGVSEFGPELWNWAAFRLTTHDRNDYAGNILSRTDLVHRGPACVRYKNGVTPQAKAKADRWVRALLDHGYIEVYEKPGARKMQKYKAEEQEAHYRIRDEFFQKFSDEATRLEFKMHNDALQHKRTTNLSALKLGPRKQPAA